MGAPLESALQLFKPKVEDSIDEIVEKLLDSRSKDTESGTYALGEDLAWHLEFHDKELDLLVSQIFTNAPKTKEKIDSKEKELLKFGMYHAILGYDSKVRKLGAHRYMNHPLLAAHAIATAYENAGESEDIVGLVMSALYHDRIEERVDKAVRKEMKKLRQDSQKFVFKDSHETNIFDQFSHIGATIGGFSVGKVPTYEGDIPDYIRNLGGVLDTNIGHESYKKFKSIMKKLERRNISDDEVLKLISQDEKVRKKARVNLKKKTLKEAEVKEAKRYAKRLYIQQKFEDKNLDTNSFRSDLIKYREILERYVPYLQDSVVKVEKKLIDDESIIFVDELKRGFEHVYGDDILDKDREGVLTEEESKHRIRLASIVLETSKMTRVGSELYYEVCSQLFDSVVKYGDGSANTVDLDRAERNPNIRFFHFNNRVDIDFTKLVKFQLIYMPVDLIIKDGNTEPTLGTFGINERVDLRNLAAEYSKDNNLDILSILQISKKDEQSVGIQELDRQLHKIIKTQHDKYHRPDNIAEQERWRKAKNKDKGWENDPPQRLSTHKRLYRLYKDVLLINNTRKGYQGEEIPGMLQYMVDQLVELTQHEALRIVEGTFSNHCQGGSNFTIQNGREIYREMKEYEADGGFGRITEGGGSRFDGLLERYFDQRARGSRTPIEKLFRDKKELFATALAVHRLTELYQEDSDFFMDGIGRRALTPAPAVRNWNGDGHV